MVEGAPWAFPPYATVIANNAKKPMRSAARQDHIGYRVMQHAAQGR
jgi:hypothetical protein